MKDYLQDLRLKQEDEDQEQPENACLEPRHSKTAHAERLRRPVPRQRDRLRQEPDHHRAVPGSLDGAEPPITIISRSCDVRSRFSQLCNDIGPFSNGSFQLLVGGLFCLSLTACAR